MESASRIFLYSGLLLVFLGLLGKSFHIPGITLTILLSVLSLVLSLILGTIGRKSKGTKKDLSFRTIGSIVFFTLGGILFFFSYTFRVQHWPGTGILTISSLIFALIGILIFAFGNKNISENEDLLDN